jgi:enolase
MSANSPSRIETIHAREVLDSRGNPTVEVEVSCTKGAVGRAQVPGGASTGRFEARELRDGDPARYAGRGVLKAVDSVRRELHKALWHLDAADQALIDKRLIELDGTLDKSRLGSNALLGVSLACAHAAAAASGRPLVEHLHALWKNSRRAAAPSGPPNLRTAALGQGCLLPLPMVNMISGGLHAGRNLDIQDVLLIPTGAGSYRKALEMAVAVYQNLGRLLTQAGFEGVLVGDEGGFGPKLNDNEKALEFVVRAIEAAGLRPGADAMIGLDVASSHFFDGTHYRLAAGTSRVLDRGAMIDMLARWVSNFPVISIEDGLAEDDWEGWRELSSRLSGRVQLIGDDLFVTNTSRLKRGIEMSVANSVLIKVNQIGTLSETFAALSMALDAGYWPVISARSGETEDTTIADLAVATGAGQIKIGSVARSERLAKYNQLLRLEEHLGNAAGYLGGKVFAGLAATR